MLDRGNDMPQMAKLDPVARLRHPRSPLLRQLSRQPKPRDDADHEGQQPSHADRDMQAGKEGFLRLRGGFRGDARSRWCHAGVWERIFRALMAERDNRYLMIDSTIVRAHQQAANGKGGPRIRRWGVPGAD